MISIRDSRLRHSSIPLWLIPDLAQKVEKCGCVDIGFVLGKLVTAHTSKELHVGQPDIV